MSELWAAYWPIILAALVIGIITGFLIFRPRQRVTLTDTSPVRPHMAQAPPTTKIIAEPTTPAPATGEHVNGDVHFVPHPSGPPDPLIQLKGVGPKLAALLNERGITRFEQIASLSPGQVEALDADLGAFRGRFTRDRIVEQADYLARGDLDGYKSRFGAL